MSEQSKFFDARNYESKKKPDHKFYFKRRPAKEKIQLSLNSHEEIDKLLEQYSFLKLFQKTKKFDTIATQLDTALARSSFAKANLYQILTNKKNN